MKSRRVAFLGLVGFLVALWFGANGCNLDTSDFGEPGDPCTIDAHCDDNNVCTTDKCGPNAVCTHKAVSDGQFPDGVRGNCKAFGCKDGVQAEIELKDDVDDGDECTDDKCTDTGASHDPSLGATCHLGSGIGKCDDMGKCVIECGYLDEMGALVGCPASDDPCTLSYCDAAVGQCALDLLDGVPQPGTDPTDCSGVYCKGGVTKKSDSLADTPCLETLPDGRTATHCDGTGACVECNSDEQCADPSKPPSFCFTAKCTDHKCANVVKDNVDLPQQDPADCKIKRCDMGLVVEVADDSDKPNDNNECTTDVCTNGVATNPDKPAGTSCGTGATGNPLVCNDKGVCVGCNTPLDCVGTDDECKARTCIAQECGVAYQPTGTAVSGQTSGDCMKQVCDGAGNVIAAVDNVDTPADDGNQCTDETCTNGQPGHPNKMAGSSCNDGNGCTQTDTCQAGSCVGNNPVVCMALDQCHDAGTCNPASGMCSNPNKSNGTTCTDSNACTQTDSCQNGTCVGASPVVCTALDQCHNAGTCNTMTGVCSNPNKNNGATCTDGNACTQTDTCQNGTCTGMNPVVCTALDSCHDVGTCNTASGMCSNPNKANGASCSDGNACTQTDSCQNGVCTGANPVVCTASDQCHNAGTCNTGTGVCSNPNKANGTSCNDNNLCTQMDSCQAGVCTGANPIVCTAMDQCHNAGTCAPATGVCSNPAKGDGAACNDNDLCTQTDTCQTGVCTGGNPKTCTASDQCHTAGTCAPATGVCSNPPKANGTSCDDMDLCTQTDTCQTGVCTGGNPKTCTALDQCHTAGTCAPATGLCSNPNKANGTSCDDMDLCTQSDSCQGGTCTGTNPVTCTAMDDCHDVGTCNMGTGMCSNPVKADGSVCNDQNTCTLADTCTAGTCGSMTYASAGTACTDHGTVGTCNATGGCN